MRKKNTKKTTAKKKRIIPVGFKLVRKVGKSKNTRYIGKKKGETGIYIYALEFRKGRKK